MHVYDLRLPLVFVGTACSCRSAPRTSPAGTWTWRAAPACVAGAGVVGGEPLQRLDAGPHPVDLVRGRRDVLLSCATPSFLAKPASWMLLATAAATMAAKRSSSVPVVGQVDLLQRDLEVVGVETTSKPASSCGGVEGSGRRVFVPGAAQVDLRSAPSRCSTSWRRMCE